MNAYEQGQQARRANAPLASNPYQRDQDYVDWGAWRDGYFAEDRALRFGYDD